MIIFVPGSCGSPPSMRIVRPAVTSWVTWANLGWIYTETAFAASMRTGIGKRSSRYTAVRNSWGLRSGSLYFGLLGPRISCSGGFLDNAAAHREEPVLWGGRVNPEWRHHSRRLRPRVYVCHTTYGLAIARGSSCGIVPQLRQGEVNDRK